MQLAWIAVSPWYDTKHACSDYSYNAITNKCVCICCENLKYILLKQDCKSQICVFWGLWSLDWVVASSIWAKGQQVIDRCWARKDIQVFDHCGRVNAVAVYHGITGFVHKWFHLNRINSEFALQRRSLGLTLHSTTSTSLGQQRTRWTHDQSDHWLLDHWLEQSVIEEDQIVAAREAS